jgi:apolipoprotein N-acyltransferase
LNWLLALASGASLLLVFPRFSQVWLAPFALAPLLIALAREFRPGRRFLLGYLAGNVYWFGVCYWIAMVLDVHGALGTAGGWATFVLFCLLKSLHYGLFSMLAGVLMRQWYAVPAVAALWAGLERTQGPSTGFEWLMLGNAAADMSLLMRLAPIAGVHAISFLFAWMSGVLAMTLLRRGRRQLAWALLFPLVVLLPDLPPPDAAPAHTAAVVQPNVDDLEQWTAERAAGFKQNMLLLSLQASLQADAPPPDLIVWPELPAPIYYDDDQTLRMQIAELARTAKAPVLFGTVGTAENGAPLNSAQLVAASGAPAGRYDKIYLVPFGEYVPKAFFWVNRITKEAGDFQPGGQVRVFPLDGMRIGSFICYESAVPRLVRQFAGQGGVVFFNLSNDGYFFRTAAREQHLLLVRMRAAENRRWILRATNNGITASIDPAGRIVRQFEPFSQVAARLPFGTIRDTTLYSEWGDWFAWLCLAGAGVALVASQWPAYRPASGPVAPRGPALLTSNSSKPRPKAGEPGRRRKS